MAITETRQYREPFVEAAGVGVVDQALPLLKKPINTGSYTGDQFVQGQADLETGAASAAEGLGSLLGPKGYQQFMSPYQQEVIDTTMSEFDRQASIQQQGLRDQSIRSGAYGGGREGVQQAEYQRGSDMARSGQLAGLLQQGFTQSNQLANQAFGQQMNLGDQQLGLSQNQQGMASLVPSLYQQDVSTLGAAGAGQQAQAQAVLDAQREGNRLEAYEPYERLGYQGQGIASIASGAPGQYQSSVTPNPTPLQTALGIATVGGGLMGNYGDMMRGINGLPS